MVIGANLPDVDVLVYVVAGGGTHALAFRRGWTHGILAMLVLPLVLAALMTWLGHAIDARRSRARAGPPIEPAQLLLLSAISIWTHPLFDLLNTYGVRLLMPFSSRWFYGDTLFIVDPWIWTALAIGAFVSLRRARRVPIGAASPNVVARSERPARIALAAVATYIAAMAASSWIGRAVVERQAIAGGSTPALRVMVSPEPVTPYTRTVVRDLGLWYEVGRLTWSPLPRYAAVGDPVIKTTNAATLAALATPDGERFASWARFPFAEVTTTSDSTFVRLDDVRYARPGQRSFAGVSVTVGRRGTRDSASTSGPKSP